MRQAREQTREQAIAPTFGLAMRNFDRSEMTHGKAQMTVQRTLVVGLGVSGLATVKFLNERGSHVSVVDTQVAPRGLSSLKQNFPHIEFRSGDFDAAWFSSFDTLVVSPGVPLTSAAIVSAREAGAEVIGDVELFLRQCRAPILAVTGSNGKSTVTAMLHRLLQTAGIDARMGGNIGIPVLDLVDHSHKPDVYVLELSSFQLESTTSLQAQAAAFLNLSADHMDRYPDLDAYQDAKARIFSDCTLRVLNRDDARVIRMADRLSGNAYVTFGSDAPERECDFGIRRVNTKTMIVRGDVALVDIDALPLTGRHNQLNVMAAIALAERLGVNAERAMPGVCAFPGLSHRMEIVGEWNGVRWINDSKSTNVGSAVAGLEGSQRPIVLIAGGMAKQGDFAPLAIAIHAVARAVVLIGRDAADIAAAIKGTPVFRADDLEGAITTAAALARPGDTVLLSPACASFDMFDNFEHRGDQFRCLVKQRFEGAGSTRDADKNHER